MGAPIRCLDELYVTLCLFESSSKLTKSSDVFMDSVNRDVSMEMMVGPSPYRICSAEADIQQIKFARGSRGKQFILSKIFASFSIA